MTISDVTVNTYMGSYDTRLWVAGTLLTTGVFSLFAEHSGWLVLACVGSIPSVLLSIGWTADLVLWIVHGSKKMLAVPVG